MNYLFLEDVAATLYDLGLLCTKATALTPRNSGQLIRQSNHSSKKSDYPIWWCSTASSSAFPQPTVCCVCHCTPWWPHCMGSACASFPNKNHDGVHHCPWTNLYHYYRSVHWVTMDCCVKFCFSWLLCWFSKCVILLLFVLSNVFSHWLTFFLLLSQFISD